MIKSCPTFLFMGIINGIILYYLKFLNKLKFVIFEIK